MSCMIYLNVDLSGGSDEKYSLLNKGKLYRDIQKLVNSEVGVL